MESNKAIVLGVDFSETSDAVIAEAVEHAKRLDAPIHVVHAFHIPLRLYTPYEIAAPDAFLAEVAEEASSKLEAIVERLTDSGITAMSHLVDDTAAKAILDVAKRVGATLIVVGARGHTGVKRALLGSVAERTTRLAPCSVLVSKPRAQAAA